MHKMLQRGFTLIELLVVIAIIGILAAVVLGSLNDARDNANDASAKTSINNTRNLAEIFYSENGFSYGTNDAATTVTPGADTVPTYGAMGTDGIASVCDEVNVRALLSAAENQTNQAARCVTDDENYAIEQLLRSGEYFCVDSTGFSGETGFQTGTPAANTWSIDGTTDSAEDVTCR